MTHGRCKVSTKSTIGSKIIWMQTMELLGDGVIWNLVSVHLETLLVLVQDRRMVCAKRTIGSEIVFDTPDGTPR